MLLGSGKFTQVEIPDNHPIFHHTDTLPTSVSKNMGLPLLVRKMTNIAFKDQVKEAERLIGSKGLGYNPYKNRRALFLNISTNTMSRSFMYADRKIWDTLIGRVLVVRQDQKDITPHQVEALSRYCKHNIMYSIQILEEGIYDLDRVPKSIERKKLIKEHMSRSEFDKFFFNLKAEKAAAGDESWANECSPYEGLDTEGGIVEDDEDISDWEEDDMDPAEFLAAISGPRRWL